MVAALGEIPCAVPGCVFVPKCNNEEQILAAREHVLCSHHGFPARDANGKKVHPRPKGTFRCEVPGCEADLSTEETLHRHYLTSHYGFKFKCPDVACSTSCVSLNILERHIKRAQADSRKRHMTSESCNSVVPLPLN